jgi:Protein of unknown function (DUF3343)
MLTKQTKKMSPDRANMGCMNGIVGFCRVFVNRLMVMRAVVGMSPFRDLFDGCEEGPCRVQWRKFPEDLDVVNEGDYIAVFNSIHRVMKAEQVLKEMRLPILLIPAPRSVSSDCGLAIRYGEADRVVVEGALSGAGLEPEMIYCRRGNEYIACLGLRGEG